METFCHKQLIFESLFSKEVVADREGERIIAKVEYGHLGSGDAP
jgi:hypothetical protein